MNNINKFNKLCKKILLFIICFSCIMTIIACSKGQSSGDDDLSKEDFEITTEIKKEINKILESYEDKNDNILNFNQFSELDNLKMKLSKKQNELIDDESSADITDILYEPLLNIIRFKTFFLKNLNDELRKKPRLENIKDIVTINDNQSKLYLVSNNTSLIKEIFEKLNKKNTSFLMLSSDAKLVYATKLSLNFNIKISNSNKITSYSTNNYFYITNISKEEGSNKIAIDALGGDFTSKPASYLRKNKVISQLDIFALLQFYPKDNAILIEAIKDDAELSINIEQLKTEEAEAIITINAENSKKYKGTAQIRIKIKAKTDIATINTGYDVKSELELDSLTINSLYNSMNKSDGVFSEEFKAILNDPKIFEMQFINNKQRKVAKLDSYSQKILIKIKEDVKTKYYGKIELSISIKLNPIIEKINFYLNNIVFNQKNNYYMWNHNSLYFGQQNKKYKLLLSLNRDKIIKVLIDNKNNYYVATEKGKIYYGVDGQNPSEKYNFNDSSIENIVINKNNSLYVFLKEKSDYPVYFINTNTNIKTKLTQDIEEPWSCVVVGNDDNVYFGTAEGKAGIIILSESKDNKLEYKIIPIFSNVIVKQKIVDIFIDKDNNWYIIYDNRNFIAWGKYTVDNNFNSKIELASEDDLVINLSIDNDGNIYILTKKSNFYFYEKIKEDSNVPNSKSNWKSPKLLMEDNNKKITITDSTILLDNNNWYLMINGKIYFAKTGEQLLDNSLLDYGDNKKGMMKFDNNSNLYIIINNEAVYIRGL